MALLAHAEAGLGDVNYTADEVPLLGMPMDTMSMEQLVEYIETMADVATSGKSLAVAAGKVKRLDHSVPEAAAWEHMSSYQKEFWKALKEGRLRLPETDWSTLHKGLLPTRQHVRNIEERRDALRALYEKPDITSEQAHAWLEADPHLIHIVKAQARVARASRTTGTRRSHVSGDRLAMLELNTCTTIINKTSELQKARVREARQQIDEVTRVLRIFDARIKEIDEMGRARRGAALKDA